MKILTKGQALLLGICILVLGYAMIQIQQVGSALQYLMIAPEPVQLQENGIASNIAIQNSFERVKDVSENWGNVLTAWSMDGIQEKGTVAGNDKAVQARVTMLGPDSIPLRQLLIRFGRSIYPEELDAGSRVILLDEQLALALFRVAEPIDREVTFSGETYRVVGIVRHSLRVGDTMDYGAYLPLKSILNMGCQVDGLCISGIPVPGSGAGVAFESMLSQLFPGGTLIDLGKESLGAWLWLRMLLGLLGLYGLFRLGKEIAVRSGLMISNLRLKLQASYALRLMPWMAGQILMLAGMTAVAILFFAMIMLFVLEPVYTFPEWVPSVLVEWSDIQSTFWSVWKKFSVMQEMRTPELMRLRFFTLVIDGFSALAGVLVFSAFVRFRPAREKMRETLTSLHRLGVRECVIRTHRLSEMQALGFVEMEQAAEGKGQETSNQKSMVRITDVRRVLEDMPGSRKVGSFVLDVTDDLIHGNSVRMEIRCEEKGNLLRETSRDWDIQMRVETLARLVYGRQSLAGFLESQEGCELHRRMDAMDGFFECHLDLGGYTI